MPVVMQHFKSFTARQAGICRTEFIPFQQLDLLNDAAFA
jgi:hypothetical protein